jgi:hypothetical protein
MNLFTNKPDIAPFFLPVSLLPVMSLLSAVSLLPARLRAPAKFEGLFVP